MIQPSIEKFTGLVIEAIEIRKSGYGKLRDAANFAVASFGMEWLQTKDSAVMARYSSDERKAFSARQKELRNIVTTEAENRGLSNPRKTWKDFCQYAREEAGISTASKTGGGSTHYDKVCEGLRMIRNHLPECEPSVLAELETAWMALEAEAVSIGMLKDTD
jgi:hypothetical protein